MNTCPQPAKTWPVAPTPATCHVTCQASRPATEPVQPFTLFGGHAQPRSPLVFDAPHCGADWPAQGTPTIAPDSALRTSWDAHLDALWAEAIAGDAPLLAARFHRAYIDANRARDDIDPELLAEAWPGDIVPCPTSHKGMGLIRRFALPGVPMYGQLLETADVQARIAQCYDPYHAMLDRLIDNAQARFGRCVHIVCLSMKSVGNAMNEDSGATRPDFVVSDQEGCSTDPFLLRWVAASLGALGHSVQLNHPYRGGELVRRHGQPGRGRHSLQIAINRALYMDETSCQRHAGYSRLVRHLTRFVKQMDAGLLADLAPRRCITLPPLAPARPTSSGQPSQPSQPGQLYRPGQQGRPVTGIESEGKSERRPSKPTEATVGPLSLAPRLEPAASPCCAKSHPPCCATGSGRHAAAAHPCGWSAR